MWIKKSLRKKGFLQTVKSLIDIHFETVYSTYPMLETITNKLELHDKRFDKIDARLDAHDKRFDEHDKRFDKIDKRFDEIDARFDNLAIKVTQNSFDIQYLKENMATKKDIADIHDTLDKLLSLMLKRDQEVTFMGERIKRIEKHLFAT